MSKSKEFIYTIGLDTTDFTKAIANSEEGLENLRKYFVNNPASIGIEMKDGSNTIAQITKIAELVEKIKADKNGEVFNKENAIELNNILSLFNVVDEQLNSIISSFYSLSTTFNSVVDHINTSGSNINVAGQVKNEVAEAEKALSELEAKQKLLSKFRSWKENKKTTEAQDFVKKNYLTWQQEAMTRASKEEIANYKSKFYSSAAAYNLIFKKNFELEHYEDDSDPTNNYTVDLDDRIDDTWFKKATEEVNKQQQLYLDAVAKVKVAKEKYGQALNSPTPKQTSNVGNVDSSDSGESKISGESYSDKPPTLQSKTSSSESAIDLKETQESTESVRAEKEAMDGLAISAGQAADAKQKFVEANAAVKESADISAKAINSETQNLDNIKNVPQETAEVPSTPKAYDVSAQQLEKLKETPLSYFSKVYNSVDKMSGAAKSKFKKQGFSDVEVKGIETLDKKIEHLTITARDASGVLKTFEYNRQKVEGQKNAFLIADESVQVDATTKTRNRSTKNIDTETSSIKKNTDALKENKKAQESVLYIKDNKSNIKTKTTIQNSLTDSDFVDANYSDFLLGGKAENQGIIDSFEQAQTSLQKVLESGQKVTVEDFNKMVSAFTDLTMKVKFARTQLKAEEAEMKRLEKEQASAEKTRTSSIKKFSKKKDTIEHSLTDEDYVKSQYGDFLSGGKAENSEIITAFENARTALNKVIETGSDVTTEDLERMVSTFEELTGKVTVASKQLQEEETKLNNLKNREALVQKNLDTLKTYEPNELALPSYNSKFEEYKSRLDDLNTQLQNNTITTNEYSRSCKSLFKELDKSSVLFTKKDGFLASVNPSDAPTYLENMRAGLTGIEKETAKLDTSKKDVAELTYNTRGLNDEISKVKITASKVTGAVEKTVVSTKQGVSELDKFFGSLKAKFQSLTTWLLSFGSMRLLWNELKQGISYVRELDTALAQLKFVTDSDNQQIAEFKQNVRGVSEEVAATSTNLAVAATDWARLGNSIEDSLTLTKASAIYAKVGFTDTETATSNLISTLKAFDYAAKDSIDIVDKFVNVDNKFAISAEEIGSGLTRSGAALKAAGNDLSESIALLTTANTVLQNADIAANTLKTVGMRLRGTTASELEAAGEDTEGVIENASKLYNTIKDLTKTDSTPSGISILTDDGAYKSTYQILLEIAEVWDEIAKTDGGDLKQAALLETIAGKTRATGVAAILQNPDILKKAFETAESSAGSSEKAMSIVMDTIDAKLTQLSNSWQIFWQEAVNSDAVKLTVDGLNSVVKALDLLINKYGGLSTLITGASGIAGAKNVGRAKMFARILCKPTPLLAW